MYCKQNSSPGIEATRIAQESSNELEERQIAEGPCSEAYLQRVTGEEDLGAVHSLILTVDTNETQVILLVQNVPPLAVLKERIAF